MILYKKNYNTNPILLTNIVFAFFPISFILGNFIVNLNILLLCCLGIFHLKSRILKAKFNLSIKAIFLLFFIIFFSTVLSFLESLYIGEYRYVNLINLTKSILFFRYFLMLIIIYLLSEFNILDFKYIFVSAAFCSFLISLDVIYQYIFGFNIIGLKGATPYNSGFFGDELIAGGYIQNFSFFSIFLVALMVKNKNSLKFLLTTIIICIIGASIILSGNRMPFILFLFGLLLAFLFNKELRKIIFVSTISLLIILKLISSYDDMVKYRYSLFFFNATNIIIGILDYSENNKSTTTSNEENSLLKNDSDSFWTNYSTKNANIKLFYTALDIWKKNKLLGNGIKSFRIDCLQDQFSETETKKYYHACSNHPHNYYLEILTETGIVGFFSTSIIALIFMAFIFKNFKFLNRNKLENYILLAATISLILEVFPIKSSGSIFSTNNATYIILISSIILSQNKILNIRSPISPTNKNMEN